MRRLRCLFLGHEWAKNYGYGSYLVWPLRCVRCDHQV